MNRIFKILNKYYEFYYVIYHDEFDEFNIDDDVDIIIENINELHDEYIDELHDELNEINIVEYVEIYDDEIKIKLHQ